MKKYEFTGKTMKHFGRELKQIRRLSDGLVGGWIEKEENLSHKGRCFVYDNAKVFDNARVYGSARVCDDAIVYGNAIVCDDAGVYDNAVVCDNAVVYDNAVVCGNAEICGVGLIYGNAEINKGVIIGEIQIPYKEIEFYRNNKSRLVTAILTLEDKWVFNIGCQKLITKEEFIERIYNNMGGLENNPHREFYLKILKMF